MEIVASPRHGVKIYQSLSVVDKSKVGIFMLLVLAMWGRKQQTWHQATMPNQSYNRCKRSREREIFLSKVYR